MSTCLRPASLSDVDKDYFQDWWELPYTFLETQWKPLLNLYDAEWRLRGFERSP